MIRPLTEGKPLKLIFQFALPMLLGNLFQQAYNMVDAIVVGNYVGPGALGAVTTSFPIINLLLAAIMGLTLGSSIIISQLFGAGRRELLRKAVSTSMYFLLAGSIAASIIGIFCSRGILQLMNTPKEILADATAYLQIYFGGLIFVFMFNALSALLRGLGDSRTPLLFLIVSTVLNILLDILFVAAFGMGVAGVAWATLISQAVSAILLLLYIVNRVELLHLTRKELVLDRGLFGKIIKIGAPSSIQQTVLSMGLLVMQGLANSYGVTFIAGFGAASRIEALAILPVLNIAMAFNTYTSQNIGAGRIDRVKQGYRATLILMTVFTVIISAAIFLFSPKLIAMFVTNAYPSVIEIGTKYLQVMAFFYIIFGFMQTSSNLLRGAGDAIVSLISTVAVLSTRVAAAYILSRYIGYSAIWWSMPIGWTIGTVITTLRYMQGKWKNKSIVSQLQNDTTNDNPVAEITSEL